MADPINLNDTIPDPNAGLELTGNFATLTGDVSVKYRIRSGRYRLFILMGSTSGHILFDQFGLNAVDQISFALAANKLYLFGPFQPSQYFDSSGGVDFVVDHAASAYAHRI